MVRVVIFDLDGTLVNAYRAVAASINHTLGKLGLPPRSYTEVRRSVGFGDRHLLRGFVGEARLERAVRIYRAHHVKALKGKGGVFLLPGVKRLLPNLRKQGIRLGIVTNRPYRFTAAILKVLDIRRNFDWVFSPDMGYLPKPHPQMINHVLKCCDASKPDMLFVGDMDIDINTGRRAMIRTVAVATGSCTTAQLKALQPFRVIARIGQLETIIKELTNE